MSGGGAKGWEEATTEIGTGAADPFEAAWYLTTSPPFRLLRDARSAPYLLGALLFLIIVATVVLSPATDSRFIYTDF